MTTVTLKIKRYNPETDKRPYWQRYEVETTPETTVLDALEQIKGYMDGSLTFRRSCRHAICGSCAMMVNRRNTLVCSKPLADVTDRRGEVMIEPLPYLPVIRDLVVDRTVFWEQYLKVKPWLVPPREIPEKEFRMTQGEVDALAGAETCIMCGACYSSCPVIAGNKAYVGPHALLKALQRVLDPRDTIPGERLDMLADSNGPFRCHQVLNCIDACPKGLNPAKAIAVLANLALRSGKIDEQRADQIKALYPADAPTVPNTVAVDEIPVLE